MANEYKQTMNLPKTGFPMRAGLSKSEPKRLKDWQDNKVYEQVLKKNEGHKSSCCTTVLRTPTARSTSATP